MAIQRYEVAILGAGAAGTTAALRLRQLGYKVVVLEKKRFPRFNIGESLSPGVKGILAYLQAEHLLAHPSYLSKLPMSILWDAETPLRTDGDQNQHTLVDRAVFDKALLDLCQERGTDVIQEAKIRHVKQEQGYWDITYHKHRQTKAIQADVIFDARGRLGVSSSDRFITGAQTVAKWALLDTSQRLTSSFLEACPSFWLWGAPLPCGQARIISFSDASLHKQRISLQDMIAQATLAKSWGSTYQLKEEKSQAIQPYWNTKAIQECYYSIGETAFALDPLSSSGVEKAMRYTLQAILAFHTSYHHKKQALAHQFLEDKLLTSVSSHAVMNQNFYEKAYFDNTYTFWSKRKQPFIHEKWQGTQQEKLYQKHIDMILNQETYVSKRKKTKLAVDLNSNMQLATELRFQKSICVEQDDLIEKEAIHHPSFQKPIAYLDGVAIAPLLRKLPSTFSLADLPSYWATSITPRYAQKVLSFLMQKDIIQQVSN